MKRTENLLEIRKMCFEEAWLGWDSARLSQEEAAGLLLEYVNGHFAATVTGIGKKDWRG